MKDTKIILIMILAVLAIGCSKNAKVANEPSKESVAKEVEESEKQTEEESEKQTEEESKKQTETELTESQKEAQKSTALIPDSLRVLGDYTGRPMNGAKDIKIVVDFEKIGKKDTKEANSRYRGSVTISYTENGVAYTGYFQTGNGDKENKNNQVVQESDNSKSGFHAILTDSLGGMVLVIDGEEEETRIDGVALRAVSGSVWYKNFGLTYAPESPTYCWYVSLGPYDCRPWPSGDGMNGSSTIYPKGGYKRLGTFKELNIEKAFNNTLTAEKILNYQQKDN